MSVLIDFQNDTLPERIKVGYISYPVREYVLLPLRCYKCQRYRHIAAVCKGKQRCPKCGGEHRYEECGENVKAKCCNCGGDHNVAYGGCDIRKRGVEVQKVKIKNNISYGETVERI